MKTYLANLWDNVRTSFWFVPALLVLSAVTASIVMPAIDRTITADFSSWWKTTTPAARSTLSAIAAAMMTVSGTVFSITVVTLSLTSQQFGPRLLRCFMLDFPTQLTIGTFLSTGVYCLLVLRIVEKQDGLPVPHLSVALAVGLNLLSMGLLIYFLHHVAVLIQAPHIVSAVAADLDDSIDRLFPERIGQNDADDEADDDRDVQRLAEKLGDGYDTVESTLEGYIQAIDASGVVCLAEHHDLVIQLLKRPGDYLSRGEPITRIWRVGDAAPENLPELINDLFIVGMRRTPRQDVECAIEELVEVAVRSLSPGINDPFTAVNCIDYLGSTLGRLAERKAPKSARYDESGCLRVLAPGVTFPNALDAAFNQIRQYGKDCPAVMIRLLEVFRSILRQTVRNCDRQAVLDHADMVMRAAERSIPEERDLEAVRERLQALEAFREPD